MIYRPRMMAIVEAPVGLGESDEVVTFPLRIRSATLEQNDHNHADELDVTAERPEAGIDPRFLQDANIAFYLGNADESGSFTPSRKNLRFVGIAREVERAASDSGHTVSIKAVDYTALFVECKQFPPQGVPTFQDSLADAWTKVCDHAGVVSLKTGRIVSVVAKLRDRIEFRGGVDPKQIIGRGVPARIARQGRLVVKHQSDAWAVWQQCVGSLGLVSYIELDKCIVTTSTDHFADDPAGTPVVIWGKNISELKESAKGGFSAKGVGLTSYNPLTGTTIEAVYPPPDDPRIQRTRVTAKKAASQMGQLESDSYEWQEYHGVTDPAVLEAIAQRAWEERSRQEMEGTFQTSEMLLPTVSDLGAPRIPQFDILNLRSGDSIRIDLDPSIDTGVFAALESDQHRFAYLTARGYAPGVATLLAKSAKQLLKLGLIYKTKRVRTQLETSEDAGSFTVDVDFWNRIEIA